TATSWRTRKTRVEPRDPADALVLSGRRKSSMRSRIVSVILAMTLVAGCGWWQERGGTTKGGVYGAGAGAAAGAAIGGIPGGDKLKQMADVLNRYPRTRVEIVGHTDSRGSDASNQQLSERRANAVREVLAQDGVAASRIVARGAGETRPVSTNDTTTGRAMNR